MKTFSSALRCRLVLVFLLCWTSVFSTATGRAATAETGDPEARDGTYEILVPFLRGDVDGDETVELDDALDVLAITAWSGTHPRCEDAADANDDGGVDLLDAVQMLQYVFVRATAMPAPASGCGEDPTYDGLGCSSGGACDYDAATPAIVHGEIELVDSPCVGGQLLVKYTRWACRRGVWHLVTYADYQCPDGRIVTVQEDDHATTDPCQDPNGIEAAYDAVVAVRAAPPCPNARLLVKYTRWECRDGVWTNVGYADYQCPDGSIVTVEDDVIVTLDRCIETNPVETSPVVASPVPGLPVEAIPADSIPADSIPADSIPADSIPVETSPVDSIPVANRLPTTGLGLENAAGEVPVPAAPQKNDEASPNSIPVNPQVRPESL